MYRAFGSKRSSKLKLLIYFCSNTFRRVEIREKALAIDNRKFEVQIAYDRRGVATKADGPWTDQLSTGCPINQTKSNSPT